MAAHNMNARSLQKGHDCEVTSNIQLVMRILYLREQASSEKEHNALPSKVDKN